MLRISITTDSDETARLRLVGSLIGPWVEELRHLSDEYLSDSKAIALDLEELQYMDAEGALLLRDLARRKVAQFNCSPFIRQQLYEGN